MFSLVGLFFTGEDLLPVRNSNCVITNQDLLEFHLVERRLQHTAKTLEHMLVQSRVK